MANYFKVVNGIVTDSIIADAEFFDTFVDSSPGEWIAESSKIKGVGGIGCTYDTTRNAWITEKPFPSWTLNETSLIWEAPKAAPTGDDKLYLWDEASQDWKEVT